MGTDQHLLSLLTDSSRISELLRYLQEKYEVNPATQAHILREICGNPWRPVTFRWSWATARETLPDEQHPPSKFWRPDWAKYGGPWESALAIAQTIYNERRWEDLPILADALSDAGCENEEILWHLRGRQRCWKCKNGDIHTTQYYGFNQSKVKDILLPCMTCNCPIYTDNTPGWVPLQSPHVRGCWVLDLLLGKE